MADKITYGDKSHVLPYGTHEIQVWDTDMNELKNVVNNHADDIDANTASQKANAITRKTLVEIQALTGDIDTLYYVLDDPTPANNGQWGFDGAVFYQAYKNVNSGDFDDADNVVSATQKSTSNYIDVNINSVENTDFIYNNNIIAEEIATHEGFVLTLGNLVVNASFNSSDFKRVKPNTLYQNNNSNHINFHDIDLNYISQVNVVTSFTTPSNCVYIRVDNSSSFDFGNVIVNEGSVLSSTNDDSYTFDKPLIIEQDTLIEANSNRIINPTDTDFIYDNNIIAETIATHEGSVLTNGVLVANASFDSSDYKKIKPSTLYQNNNSNHVDFYDLNQIFISAVNAVTSFTTPSGCKYIRVDNAVSGISFSSVIVTEGTVLGDLGVDAYKFNKPLIINELGDWSNKNITLYGDSITAISNGDFTPPYTLNTWGNILANYHDMSNQYGRGIGSQKYSFGTNGGSVAFVDTITGNYDSRDDGFNYDNYGGATPAGTTKIRGAFSSWLRIVSMYPVSIKDDIDVVFIMGATNDSIDATDVLWVGSDTTDTEWVASAYYATYGGDYNLATLKGGVASTIMKIQAWMPQAIIVIGTPLSGGGTTGIINVQPLTDSYTKSIYVREVASLFSIPLADVNANCGINGLNRLDYITDGTHPYSQAGNEMLARAVIGGFKTILPQLNL